MAKVLMNYFKNLIGVQSTWMAIGISDGQRFISPHETWEPMLRSRFQITLDTNYHRSCAKFSLKL